MDFLWLPSVLSYNLAKISMLLAVVTIAMGSRIKNPAAVMSERALYYEASGFLKITRHSVQSGVLIFSAHLLANGDSASILFFGTFALLSFLAMLSRDPRRRRETDLRYQVFINETSMVLFGVHAR